MRLGSPHAIESLRSQTGDPVCQQVAVLLAKIRDATSGWARLRSLPPTWRRCRRAGPVGGATGQVLGRVHS